MVSPSGSITAHTAPASPMVAEAVAEPLALEGDQAPGEPGRAVVVRRDELAGPASRETRGP